MTSYPDRLLYVTKNKCAPGFKKLSDEIQARKYGLLHRALAMEGDTNDACWGLINRSARFYGLSVTPGQMCEIGPSSNQNYWMRSLLERIDECDLKLTIGGINMKATFTEHILSNENVNLFSDS